MMSDREGSADLQHRKFWFVAALAGTAAYLYRFLFVPPFTPYLLSGIGDSLLYLAPALRMFHGEILYRDFFEFITPGTALVNLGMFDIFGVRLWVPNLLALALGVGMVWVGMAIAGKLLPGRLAFLPAFAFLVGSTDWLCDPVHHWYSMLAGLCSIFVLLEQRSPWRIAFAGVLCGVSASFTQTRGFALYVGLALYLCWEAWTLRQGWKKFLNRQGIFFASALAVFLLINGYFIWKAGPARYFWCTVVFVLKYYPMQADWNSFRSVLLDFPPLALTRESAYGLTQWSFLFLLNPVAYLLFFGAYLRNRRSAQSELWARPMLVAFAGLFMYLCVAPSPNANRMSVSILPALILLVWLVGRAPALRRWMLPVATVLVVLVGLHHSARRIPPRVGELKTPRGNLIITTPEFLEQYSWILAHTSPGEYMYDADFSDMYFYLDLRNPTILPRAVDNGYTTKDQVTQAIAELEQRKPRVIFWALGDPLQLPEWERPEDARLQPMLDYIASHYIRAQVFNDGHEVWQRTAP
jgi:hypothetical protein